MNRLHSIESEIASEIAKLAMVTGSKMSSGPKDAGQRILQLMESSAAMIILSLSREGKAINTCDRFCANLRKRIDIGVEGMEERSITPKQLTKEILGDDILETPYGEA